MRSLLLFGTFALLSGLMFTNPAYSQSAVSQSSVNSVKSITQFTVQSSVAAIRVSGSDFDLSMVALDLVLEAIKSAATETSGAPSATASDLKAAYEWLKPLTIQMSAESASRGVQQSTDFTGNTTKATTDYSSDISDTGTTEGTSEVSTDGGEFSQALGEISIGVSYLAYDILLAEQVEAAMQEIVEVFQMSASSGASTGNAIKAAFQTAKEIIVSNNENELQTNRAGSSGISGSSSNAVSSTATKTAEVASATPGTIADGVSNAPDATSAVVSDPTELTDIGKYSSENIASESSEGTSAAGVALYVNPILDGSGITESAAVTALSLTNISGEISVSSEDMSIMTDEDRKIVELNSAVLELMHEIKLNGYQDVETLARDPMIVQKAFKVQEAYGYAVHPYNIIQAAVLDL